MPIATKAFATSGTPQILCLHSINMRIFVAGTRGIPAIPGGIEKHCEMLYPLIARRGHEIVLATRSPYVSNWMQEWRGVRLIRTFSPRTKHLEAIVHTLFALMKARWHSPDIVHIHAVGPALLTPLARLSGLRVVVTHHGSDYERAKWGRAARFVLRLGEILGGRYASEVIAISKSIADLVKRRCDRDPHLIYNGVRIPQRSAATDFLQRIGVVPGGYVLTVARFVPEKGLNDLLNAFRGVNGQCQLVIAGDADHETPYSRKLRETAAHDGRVVLTGYVTGEPLHQLYSHARLFVLASHHEGLPIALLEAMSYGLSVLASDIPANRELDLPAERYFRCGHVRGLQERIETLVHKELAATERQAMQAKLQELYDWERIAEQTIEVYEKALLA